MENLRSPQRASDVGTRASRHHPRLEKMGGGPACQHAQASHDRLRAARNFGNYRKALASAMQISGFCPASTTAGFAEASWAR